MNQKNSNELIICKYNKENFGESVIIKTSNEENGIRELALLENKGILIGTDRSKEKIFIEDLASKTLLSDFDTFHCHYNHADMAIKTLKNDICYRAKSNVLKVIKNLRFGPLEEQSDIFEIRTLEDDRISDFKLLKNERVILITDKGFLKFVDYNDEPLSLLQVQFDRNDYIYKEIYSMDISKDEKYIAIAIENEYEGSTIELYEIKENMEIVFIDCLKNTHHIVSLKIGINLHGFYILTGITYDSPYLITYFGVNEFKEVVLIGSIEDGINDCSFEHLIDSEDNCLLTGSGNVVNVMSFKTRIY